MDRDLVEQAQRGERDAYEALARASASRLYRIASRIVRDFDLAEDAVQQTLVAMWRELPSLRDPDRFEAWTYRLVVRFCLAESRRARRKGVREIRLDELTPARTDAFADSDLRDQLDRALAALSVDHRRSRGPAPLRGATARGDRRHPWRSVWDGRLAAAPCDACATRRDRGRRPCGRHRRAAGMTATFEFDRLLESVLDADGPQTVPPTVVEAALTQSRAHQAASTARFGAGPSGVAGRARHFRQGHERSHRR